jgi:signal transduction histidine kinase
VQRLVDRLFYRERYDYLKALEQFTRETQSVTNLNGLASALTGTVALAMQAKSAYLMLPSPQKDDFIVHSPTGTENSVVGSLPASSIFLTWMSRNNRYLTYKDLDILPELRGLKADERKFLKDLAGEIHMPMKTPAGMTGVLVLGPKLSQEPYSNEDIALLWTLSRQAAMSIENARLYAEEKERASTLGMLERMKSEFLVSASHQLKTPLTSIKVAADMLFEDEEKNPSPTRQSMIQTLSIGVDSLQKLVNEVLDFAKMRTATLEMHWRPANIIQLIKDVVALMSPAIQRKQQHLEIELPTALPPVMIDRQRLEQVLVNLLENASKFTPRRGDITVRANSNKDLGVVVEVEDTGPGISETEWESIFEPYYQRTDPSGYYEGTGLGLSIAKSLVELHGGKIWLKNKAGNGSIFYFSIPVERILEARKYSGILSSESGSPEQDTD